MRPEELAAISERYKKIAGYDLEATQARARAKNSLGSSYLAVDPFPFQVPLSFDDAAMEVLELLDDAPFEWDMFVDLQDNAIRYCFCTLTDAMAFRLRFGNASERRAGASGH